MKTVIACAVAAVAVTLMPGAWPGLLLCLIGFAVYDITGPHE